ncbi:alpha/beta hydrolase [Leptospira idonii]|uniref:Alpha/beta hydrolase n=1 Tax=Leptospira idonii TaxID=1193500 RepID=A0A4R9M3M3_9LEPT|nr:alpha/beta hydrolase [Leptospira idonii]TGN19388.1 alpha/beta hydrolase [Leptospira idonii]
MSKYRSLFHKTRNSLPSLALISVFIFLIACTGRPSYTPKQPVSYTSFEDFYQKKLTDSKAKGHRPGNEERYISYGKKTKLAFLYIHGFGASRAEGEAVMEKLSKTYKANTYLLRLPGHGTNKEDQAAQNFSDYLDASAEALEMMQGQGDKVIIFGSSLGGLLCTWLASEFPDKVDGMVLANPFYGPVDGSLNILNYPGGLSFIHLLKGKVRNSSHNDNPKVLPQRNDFWYGEQYYSALVGVNDLRNYVSRPEVFRKVTSPTLLLYYYKNDKEQDPTASVPKMREGFANLGLDKSPNPLNREVRVEDGMHVLMSQWVITDKLFIEKSVDNWLKDLAKLK